MLILKLLEVIIEAGEFIFIDVVVSKRQYIDFSSIEEIMTKSEINSGIAHEVWDYLTSNESIKQIESIDDKILKLLNKRILIPIVEDFLLWWRKWRIKRKSLRIIDVCIGEIYDEMFEDENNEDE